jgi:hypothetical protein
MRNVIQVVDRSSRDVRSTAHSRFVATTVQEG